MQSFTKIHGWAQMKVPLSYNQSAFILEDNIFAFKWSHSHNVFKVGLINPLDTSLPNVFSFIFRFSLIFMNMQMGLFSYMTTG